MTQTTTREPCPTTWLLERYHHGYLTGHEREDVEQHLSHCSRCQSWQQELAAIELPPLAWDAIPIATEATADAPAPSEADSAVLTGPLQQVREPAPLWWRSWWSSLVAVAGRPWLYAGAAACVFALVLWRGALMPAQPLSLHPTPAPTPGWRAKGSHDWQIYVRRRQSQQVHRLGRGAPDAKKPSLFTDDALRFHFDLTKRLYVMVVSINQRGQVSLYYPYPQTRAAALSAGVHRLPRDSAIPLDDYLGAELFLMIAKETPFSYRQVKQALLSAYRRRGTAGKHRLDKLPQLPRFSWQVRRLVQKVAVKP